MSNKPRPGSPVTPNGARRRSFSLLSPPATLCAQLHKRPRLRTTTQLLIVGIVALGGVGIIRTPHSKLAVAKAQDSGDDWTGSEIPPSGSLTLDDPFIGQSPDFGPSSQNAVPTPFNPPDGNYYTDKAASDQANQVVSPTDPTTSTSTAPSSSASIGVPASGPSVEYSQAGTDQSSAGGIPPDTHGAVGRNYYVEIVNDQIIVYPRLTSPGSSFPDQLGTSV